MKCEDAFKHFASGERSLYLKYNWSRPSADALSSFHVGFYVVAGDRLVYASPACTRITGYSSKKLLATDPLRWIHPEDRGLFKNALDKTLTGKTPDPFDYRILKKGKACIRILSTFDGIVHLKQKAVLVSMIDISRYKRVEETVGSEEDKYGKMLQEIDENYYENDLKGNLTFVNDAMVRHLGYPKEELLGMNYRQYHDPETAKKMRELYRKVYETGNPFMHFEGEFIRKDGSKRHAEVSGALMRDRKGRPIGFHGVSQDITERKRIEEELRASEERYRMVMDNIDQGCFENDLKGNFIFVNDAQCRDLGYTRGELIGMNYRQYTDEAMAQKNKEAYAEIFRTGKPLKGFVSEYIRKDGKKITAETFVSLMRDSSGNPIGFRGISLNVTERKKMEDALRASEEKYRTIIESIVDGYVEVDLSGNWTFVNDVICGHMRYSREELLKMNFHQLHTPQSARRAVKAFAEVLATGIPLKSLEIEALRKDGSVGFYEISVSLIKDSQGRPLGFRCISRDINERKAMEESLRQSEERYRTIMDEMEEWYFESDLKGNLLFFNEAIARILGYEPGTLSGMNFKEIIGPEKAGEVYRQFHQVFVTGQPLRSAPYEFARQDGTVVFAEFSIFPKRDAAGRMTGFRAVGHDITEKKKAQHQRLLTEKMASIGELTAGAAREIADPVFYIKSNLKAIGEYLSDVVEIIRQMLVLFQAVGVKMPAEENIIYERLVQISDAARHMKLDFVLDDLDSLVKESQDSVEHIIRIIRDLASYGHQDKDQPRMADLNELLETALNGVWKELKYKAVVTKDYGALPRIPCYPEQIHQVFKNLLANASEAIEEEGEIRIATRVLNGSRVEICIQDTGKGIAEENLSKIFDPFFTTKDARIRTGLGLNVVYSIINRHGGKVNVESAVGSGSIFTITLPVS